MCTLVAGLEVDVTTIEGAFISVVRAVKYSSSDTVAAPDLVDTYDSVRWKCVI